jgi:hypothetical protein
MSVAALGAYDSTAVSGRIVSTVNEAQGLVHVFAPLWLS